MLEPGAQIEKYIVEEPLGAGGMGAVFRVRHAVLDTHFALKVLDPGLRVTLALRERFLAEGRIAARLQHPNIVRVTDTVSTADVAGLVMELVKGPSLERHIAQRSEPIASRDEVLDLFVPVLEAVQRAHTMGVVHRDLKPANILLATDDERYIPKVTDFGIAKIIDADGTTKNRTRADARLGTVSYMSPEQIRAAREVTPRSDIFSLGATLYELATGQAAFGGDSDFEIMERIVNGRVTDPELFGRLDPTIADASRRALDPDPRRRFSSCSEFARAVAPDRRGIVVHQGSSTGDALASNDGAQWESFISIVLDQASQLTIADRRTILERIAVLYERELGDHDNAFIVLFEAFKEASSSEALRSDLERLARKLGAWNELNAVIAEQAAAKTQRVT